MLPRLGARGCPPPAPRELPHLPRGAAAEWAGSLGEHVPVPDPKGSGSTSVGPGSPGPGQSGWVTQVASQRPPGVPGTQRPGEGGTSPSPWPHARAGWILPAQRETPSQAGGSRWAAAPFLCSLAACWRRLTPLSLTRGLVPPAQMQELFASSHCQIAPGSRLSVRTLPPCQPAPGVGVPCSDNSRAPQLAAAAPSPGSGVVMHDIPWNPTIHMGQLPPGLSRGPGCQGPPCWGAGPQPALVSGGLSGRSRRRPATQGRTRHRDASCKQQFERPTDGQPQSSPPPRGDGWHRGAAPSCPGQDPRTSADLLPAPAHPTLGGSALGPTAENRKSIRKGNTGRGPVCTQRLGTCLQLCPPQAARPTPPAPAPPGPVPPLAQGENPNTLPAAPHHPGLGQGEGVPAAALWGADAWRRPERALRQTGSALTICTGEPRRALLPPRSRSSQSLQPANQWQQPCGASCLQLPAGFSPWSGDQWRKATAPRQPTAQVVSRQASTLGMPC